MTKSWSQGNSYLRLVSTLQQERHKHMTICTLSEVELQLVLQAVQLFKISITTGEVVSEVTRYKDKPGGVVAVYIDDSKEMS